MMLLSFSLFQDLCETAVLTASGEVAENLLSAFSGAFNWYQLVQVPIEIFVPIILRKFCGCDEIAAYGGGKLVSFLTSAGIGFVAGPFGALGAAAFWIAAEIIAWALRKLFEKVFGDSYIKFFGESKTEGLVKRIVNWFRVKFETGLIYGLKWFYNLPESSQRMLLS